MHLQPRQILTSDLVSTFRKLVSKIHASPLLTENLCTAQIGGPAAELIMEEVDEDNINDTQQATRQGIEGGGNTAAKSLGFHRSPRGHTLKLIQNVVTRWNSTYYMLVRCTLTDSPLQTYFINELGLEVLQRLMSAAKMLCQFLKPFQIVTDYLRGEKYPTLGSLSRKITQLMLYLSRPKSPQSWGLLNKTWVDLPTPVSSMQDFLLRDMKRRWDTGNVLLGIAAIVDP